MSLRDYIPQGWDARDWRHFIALLASVGGGAVSFVLAWRALTFLARDDAWTAGLSEQHRFELMHQQIKSLFWLGAGILLLMGISILGLWFVLGNRKFEAELGRLKVSAEGGEATIKT